VGYHLSEKREMITQDPKSVLMKGGRRFHNHKVATAVEKYFGEEAISKRGAPRIRAAGRKRHGKMDSCAQERTIPSARRGEELIYPSYTGGGESSGAMLLF